MIDEQLLAQHLLQSLRELRGKGYFGHKIQCLFAFGESILNEMDVYRGLAAGSYAVQQGDVVRSERLVNLGVGALLFVSEHRRVGMAFAHHVKSVDGLLVEGEHALIDGGTQHRLSHASALEQRVFGHLGRLRALQPVRQVEKRQQQCFLFLGACHLVEQRVQRSLVAVFDGESHTGFGFRSIVIHHSLGNVNGFALEHAAHNRHYVLESG